MNKPINFSLSFFVCALLFLSACKGSTDPKPDKAGPTDDLSRAAEKCCDCLQPSIEMNARMQELIQSDRKEEVIQLSEQAGEQAREAFECCLSVWVRYGLDTLTPQPARQMLSEKCPSIPPLMLEDLLITLYPERPGVD